MSIAEEIQKLQTNLSNSYTSCGNKGATLPTNQNFDNLASTIDSISGGSGGGATVTAINKTGASINSGDKVWLNQNSTIAGSHYNTGDDSGSGSINTGVIYPTGNKIFVVGYIGNLTVTEYTRIGEAVNRGAYGNTRYLDNGGFVCSTFTIGGCQYFDENNNIDIGSYFHIGENYFQDISGTYAIDLRTGEIQTTWTGLPNNQSTDIKIGDYIYRLVSNQPNKYSLPVGGGAVTSSTYNYTGTISTLYVIDVTKDNKYIICSGRSGKPSVQNINIRLVEVVDENTLHFLSKGEMPVDLQYFYDNNCFINFNKQSGILTCSSYRGTEYVVMKYVNGSWTKLSVDLGIEEGRIIYGAVNFSNDMTRAVVPLNPTDSKDEIRIVNLTTQSGYIAQQYGFYNVNSNTITGYATEDAVADANFTTNIASTDGGGGGSQGEEITAINKTGRVLNEGDKVWVNQHSQIAGSSFNVTTNNTNGNVFIDLTGTWAWSNNKYFTLTDSSGTQIGTTDVSASSIPETFLRYGPQNSIFFGNWRLDPEAIYHLSNSYIGGNYMLRNSNLIMAIDSFDLTTGNVLETYEWNLSKKQKSTALVVYNYGENNTPSVYMWGQSPNTTCYRYYIETGSYGQYTTNETMIPIAVTPDNKYLIGYSGSNYLRMADISNNGNPVILSQSQMSEDLQPYYSEKTCRICFNPHNNILSIAGVNSSNYVVMKYADGTWTKLNVEIPAPHNFCTLLTFSNDLSRCCFANYSDINFRVINLTSYEGYIAQDYSAYVNSESTLTGVASETVQPDESLSISTVVPK